MSVKSEIRNTVYNVINDLGYYNSIINYPFDNSVWETLKFPTCVFELKETNCEFRNKFLVTSLNLEMELWIEIKEGMSTLFTTADDVDSILFTAFILSCKDRINGLGKYIQDFNRINVEYLQPDNQFLVIKVIYTIKFLTKDSDLSTNILNRN